MSRKHCMALLSCGIFLIWVADGLLADKQPGKAALLACTSNAELPEEEIIAQLMENYDKHVLPVQPIVDVYVEVHVSDIIRVSEISSEFELDLYISSVWIDPALNFQNLSVCAAKNITMDLVYLDRIWQPYDCIVNSKTAITHESPSLNIFLILYQNGMVWKNSRVKVVAPCSVDLRKFPFDSQSCEVIFESYPYTTKKVRLSWFQHNAVTLIKPIELPHFMLTEFKTEKFQKLYTAGEWDQLRLVFYLQRRRGLFVLQVYVPTVITLFAAWINMWMSSQELGARATLTVSAFLALSVQYANILGNLPPVSYTRAIDVWMLGGLFLLCASICEVGLISCLQRSDLPPTLHIPKEVMHTCNKDTAMVLVILNKSCFDWRNPYWIDHVCLALFPVAFLLFHIFFFCYYLA